MVFIIFGALAFALFLIYDINGAGKNYTILKLFFAIGLLLLFAATAGIIWLSADHSYAMTPLFALISILMLALLVYTLFFAIPFKSAYVEGKPPLCMTGMYALCRHPGILWLGFMYAALFGALPCVLTAAGALIFTALDIGYAIFQDIYTFPRIFPDYGEYRHMTPFLIPTPDSFGKALHGR